MLNILDVDHIHYRQCYILPALLLNIGVVNQYTTFKLLNLDTVQRYVKYSYHWTNTVLLKSCNSHSPFVMHYWHDSLYTVRLNVTPLQKYNTKEDRYVNQIYANIPLSSWIVNDVKTKTRNPLGVNAISILKMFTDWHCAPAVLSNLQYIPKNMNTGFALLCFVVVIHWLFFPYPSGLLHWHCGNLTIAPVPAKQPWWIWINTSCEFIMNDCITTTKQSTTKPCAYFLRYTVDVSHNIMKPFD